VVTGNALPRSIDGLDGQLRSRLCTGLVAELEAPDAEVRRKILRERAAAGGVSLPEDCLQLLVDSLRGNVRDLEGVLTQVVASAALLERRIDIDLTRRALDKVVPALPAEACLEIPTVMELVGSFFKLRPEALASRSRRHEVLVPRQLAMYLCCHRTQASVAEIAHAFGRAHPAVRNAVRRVEQRTLHSAPSRYQLEAISARLDEIARARAR
ncbi:MAG: helix-turn-helix domain-containing protein, partial [Myxococcota bacterium]